MAGVLKVLHAMIAGDTVEKRLRDLESFRDEARPVIPTTTRLAVLERDFGRIDVADQPKVSTILEEGRDQIRDVEEPLDLDQLAIDARRPGIEGAMAAGWLRVAASRRERGSPSASAEGTASMMLRPEIRQRRGIEACSGD